MPTLRTIAESALGVMAIVLFVVLAVVAVLFAFSNGWLQFAAIVFLSLVCAAVLIAFGMSKQENVRLLRTVLAFVGIAFLVGHGLNQIPHGPLIRLSSGDAAVRSIWQLFKAGIFVGAAVSLARIWVDAVESHDQADFLERELRDFQRTHSPFLGRRESQPVPPV